MFGYRNDVDTHEHVAITFGDVSDGEGVLVRMHSKCLTGDVFHSMRCDCGWQLETAMQIMAVAIIPVAVSVHTIVSFDFSMAPVPMWQTTIFGPYFVAGAIFSGIAALLIAMAVLRQPSASAR